MASAEFSVMLGYARTEGNMGIEMEMEQLNSMSNAVLVHARRAELQAIGLRMSPLCRSTLCMRPLCIDRRLVSNVSYYILPLWFSVHWCICGSRYSDEFGCESV